MIRISSFVICIGLMALIAGCQPSTNQNRVAVTTRLQLGEAYITQQQYEIARYHFQKVLSVMPKHPEANAGMALTYELTGDAIQARHYYKLAVKSKPVNVNVLRLYGNFLCKQNLLNDKNAFIEDMPPDYLVCQQGDTDLSQNLR